MRVGTLMCLGALLLLAGCSTGPSRAGTTDSDLEQSIKARLGSDPAVLAANLHVSANASNNAATLSGTVTSEDLRTRAVELAKSAQPNLTVTDKIDVKPPELSRSDYTEDTARAAREKAKAMGDKVGRSIDDAWLYSKIMAQLAADPNTSAIKVNVDVNDKTVTLRGRVDSEKEKAEAERVAKDTDGVTGVRDRLTVIGG